MARRNPVREAANCQLVVLCGRCREVMPVNEEAAYDVEEGRVSVTHLVPPLGPTYLCCKCASAGHTFPSRRAAGPGGVYWWMEANPSVSPVSSAGRSTRHTIG